MNGRAMGWIPPRLVALVALCLGACEPAPPEGGWARDIDAGWVAGERVRAHMAILAADDMQGREAGTGGYVRAAAYVARQFSEIGLLPAPGADDFLQPIGFLASRPEPEAERMSLIRGDQVVELRPGVDFVQAAGFGAEREAVRAPLAFVGYGIRAAEYAHDDLAGIDLRGRIAVMLTGAPAGFATDERAFYSSSAAKRAEAASRGAVGTVFIRTPVDRERLTWARVQAAAAAAGLRWLEPGGTARDGLPELAADAMLSESGAERLFGLAGRDLAAIFQLHANGGQESFELGIEASLARHSVQWRLESPNVVGVLAGSDPALRHEHVLFTAHLDHLGLTGKRDGDAVYNGAYDNAAGVAVMLEVASALARLRPAPRRSVIFAALTAEEKGMRGSDYLAHHPPVPIADIVANINIDMPYLGYPAADVEGFGVEHSSLHGALERAVARLGLSLTPDPRPELVRLIRSDQFSFVKRGVPGLNLKPGSRSADPLLEGAALRDAFLSAHYHHPSDDLQLPFNTQGAARFAHLAATFGLFVANADDRPAWKANDFFGTRFGRDARGPGPAEGDEPGGRGGP